MNNQWRDNANLMVVWADGSYDSSRRCDSCNGHDCKTPVHTDFYREVGTTDLERSEAEGDASSDLALSYWDYMHTVQPFGGKRDHDGELITPESSMANPDNLAEGVVRNSGITEQQHGLMERAYLHLTGKQKEVWHLVMREQVPQVIVAAQLQISGQAVEQMLDRAKKSVEQYLLDNQNNDLP